MQILNIEELMAVGASWLAVGRKVVVGGKEVQQAGWWWGGGGCSHWVTRHPE